MTPEFFNYLDKVESSNNYATGMIHAGLAMHGMSWLAKEQTQGKGQRGKKWKSTADESILLSIALQPDPYFAAFPFIFSAKIALSVISWAENATGKYFRIKWPNDIYFNDNKAGGILIENIYEGAKWVWSVVGIGINLNQKEFPSDLPNPISFYQINHQKFSVNELAIDLRNEIMKGLSVASDSTLKNYNQKLYKRGAEVLLKKDNAVFKTTIQQVNAAGELLTRDTLDRAFTVGEVEWILKNP